MNAPLNRPTRRESDRQRRNEARTTVFAVWLVLATIGYFAVQGLRWWLS